MDQIKARVAGTTINNTLWQYLIIHLHHNLLHQSVTDIYYQKYRNRKHLFLRHQKPVFLFHNNKIIKVTKGIAGMIILTSCLQSLVKQLQKFRRESYRKYFYMANVLWLSESNTSFSQRKVTVLYPILTHCVIFFCSIVPGSNIIIRNSISAVIVSCMTSTSRTIPFVLPQHSIKVQVINPDTVRKKDIFKSVRRLISVTIRDFRWVVVNVRWVRVDVRYCHDYEYYYEQYTDANIEAHSQNTPKNSRASVEFSKW